MAHLSFNRGQLFQVESQSQILIVNFDGDAAPDNTKAEALGSGATGAVYRGLQDRMLPRAVKILDPADELRDKLSLDELVRVFQQEKVKLSQLTHSHIAKLISFGFYQQPGEHEPTLPYLVMEYIDGHPIHTYVAQHLRDDAHNDPTAGSRILLALLHDILAALQYMHDHIAVHADVKEANIIVRQADRPEAVLVDLGCAHIFSAGGTAEDELTTFNSTKSRCEHKWAARVNTVVPSKDIRTDRVSIDLHQFGVMLDLLLKVEDRTSDDKYAWQHRTHDALQWAIGELGLVILTTVGTRCRQHFYRRAADVANDLNMIASGFASPLGVPEMSMGTDASTSISLPEGRVSLTRSFSSVVNHPLVQRLQGVSQLNFLRLVYPGASHTRFLHSLEAYDLTRQYVAALCGDPVYRSYAADRDTVYAALVAGLTHDIGHYPLEHVFEDFAAKREGTGVYADVLNDDAVMRAIMMVGPEHVRARLREAADELCARTAKRLRRKVDGLADLVRQTYGEGALIRLRDILWPKEGDVGARIAHSIIDGPIDVDKVAYLRTDALMTGAKYGRCIDLDPLLGSLTCFNEGAIGDSKFDPTIAIQPKGVCSVESVTTSRRWMFQRVYWHHSNRAMMSMLRFALQYLMDRQLLTFDEYVCKTFGFTDVEAVKWIDAEFQRAIAADAVDLENPALCLLEGSRVLYKRIVTIRPTDDGKRATARTYLQNRPCGEWLNTARDIAEVIRKSVPGVKDSDVLLDIPVCDRPALQDLPVKSPQGWTTMARVSDEYKQTRAFFTSGSMYSRVYVHPEVRRAIVEREKMDAVEEAIIERLAGQS